MRNRIGSFVVAITTALLLALAMPAEAGRIGGPMTTTGTVPGGLSVYYDISFAAGELATVTVLSDNNPLLFVLLYDADGHVVIGEGAGNQKTATMSVYRGGVFRVEVRNTNLLGSSNFTLATN